MRVLAQRRRRRGSGQVRARRCRTGVAALCWFGAASAASAQGLTLYGDARLGLGYNIQNDGEPDLVEATSGGRATFRASGDLRPVSRVEFGALLTGESDGGLGFGAELEAHDAEGGNDGTEGEAFISGAFGTLVVGDADGADAERVGDAVETLSLTGLGDLNETPFVSNGGGFGNDAVQFADNPDARPTLRYDYEAGGFGLSLSTDRALRDLGAGASYVAEFEDGEIGLGLGLYDFAAFETEGGDYIGPVAVPAGRQWSGSLRAQYGDLAAGVVYTRIDAGDAGRLDVLSLGAAASVADWEVAAYYVTVGGSGPAGDAFGGRNSFGASTQYDLGGGASLNIGAARTFGSDAVRSATGEAAPALDGITVADFGITLTF